MLKVACGVDYDRASHGAIEIITVEGAPIPVAGKELLIDSKQTVRPSDAAEAENCRGARSAADVAITRRERGAFVA